MSRNVTFNLSRDEAAALARVLSDYQVLALTRVIAEIQKNGIVCGVTYATNVHLEPAATTEALLRRLAAEGVFRG